MKINLHHKFTWKLLSIILLVIIMMAFNQCVVQQYNTAPGQLDLGVVSPGGNDSMPTPDVPAGGSSEFIETGATDVAKLSSSIGVKDFEEIYMSFVVLTGINLANESGIRNLFNNLNSQLPTDNDVKAFMTSQQVAVIKLAGEFCHRLFENSTYYNAFFTNFNINQTPNQGLNEAGKLLMVNDFINRFWGLGVQPPLVEDNARNALMVLIDDLKMGENLNATSVTRKIAKGVCTSLLASAPVTLL
jgi:hypothetical protein